MDSRILTTASISKTLREQADTASITAAHVATTSSTADIANQEQAKLDRIANQASNMPHGVGVIVSKTIPIERLSKLCSGIRDFISNSQIGMLASIYWGIGGYAAWKNFDTEIKGAPVENQCYAIMEKSGSGNELMNLCDSLSKLSWDLKIGFLESSEHNIAPYAGGYNKFIKSHSAKLENECRNILSAESDSRTPTFKR